MLFALKKILITCTCIMNTSKIPVRCMSMLPVVQFVVCIDNGGALWRLHCSPIGGEAAVGLVTHG